MKSSSTKKIFGIGLSKTGTTSLYAALHDLGYRSGTFGHLKELGLEDWFRGDFGYDYLEGFDALTDLPIGSFFPQLDKRYPGSKFILTIRDLDSWLASCERQFAKRPEPLSGFVRDVRMAAYSSAFFNEERFRYTHATHRTNVEWYFLSRSSNLLIFDICGAEAWSKLCNFLDREIPQIPFPNVKPGYRVNL